DGTAIVRELRHDGEDRRADLGKLALQRCAQIDGSFCTIQATRKISAQCILRWCSVARASVAAPLLPPRISHGVPGRLSKKANPTFVNVASPARVRAAPDALTRANRERDIPVSHRRAVFDSR